MSVKESDVEQFQQDLKIYTEATSTQLDNLQYVFLSWPLSDFQVFHHLTWLTMRDSPSFSRSVIPFTPASFDLFIPQRLCPEPSWQIVLHYVRVLARPSLLDEVGSKFENFQCCSHFSLKPHPPPSSSSHRIVSLLSYLQSSISKTFQRCIIDALEQPEIVSTMLLPGTAAHKNSVLIIPAVLRAKQDSAENCCFTLTVDVEVSHQGQSHSDKLMKWVFCHQKYQDHPLCGITLCSVII